MEQPKKITPEEFVFTALAKLRDPRYKGLHTVWSGFNAAFKQYFGTEADPVATLNQMATDGKIKMHPFKGGAKIYYPNELDGDPVVSSGHTLKKMGLGEVPVKKA